MDRRHGPRDPRDSRTAAVLHATRGPRLLSPFILAASNRVLSTPVGRPAARRLMDEVIRGAHRLDPFDVDDVTPAAAIVDRYGHLDLGLADEPAA